jgi:hypothetical protein
VSLNNRAKVLALVVASIVVLLGIAINFSEKVTKYDCEGKYQTGKQLVAGQVFLKLSEYRWWVGLWSKDSEGNLWVEFRRDIDGISNVPMFATSYYSKVDYVADNVHVYEENGKSPVAHLSLLSKKLTINTPYGFFDGTCK